MTEEEEFEFRHRLEQEQAGSQTPTVERLSPMQRFARGAGIAARGVIEGAAGLPFMITDSPVTVARATGQKTGKTGQELLHDFLTKIGLPEPETTQEKVMDFAAGVAPGVIGGAVAGANKIGGSLQDIGRGLMASALKPTLKAWQSGDAALAIETMLQKGVNATAGGAAKMRGEIDALNAQITRMIANSPATVDKGAVLSRLNGLVEKFKKQVNPQSDINAIEKAWLEFRDHPLLRSIEKIPVQLAQEMKQGTYKQLAKKYGQLGSGEVEAQKGLARGLKEEISNVVPDVAKLNAEESRLIRTLGVAERRAMMDQNKNPAGLALLTHNPASFAAFMADKSALFKSLLARTIYGGARPIGGAVGAGAGMTLADIARSTGREEAP